jgi:hypothetical protein
VTVLERAAFYVAHRLAFGRELEAAVAKELERLTRKLKRLARVRRLKAKG